MHENNSFITLTYDDKNLKSAKLIYQDFQLFMKRLRDKNYRDFLSTYGLQNWKSLSKEQRKKKYNEIKIGCFVTGEYGDKHKRPHWHAILFNWRPNDCIPKRTNELGDKCYTSNTLTTLWNKGLAELGEVTFRSAGYVARYASKKLIHGRDQDHDYQPISKKSNHQAIGKTFLEKYWKDIFSYGEVILEDGKKCAIPRYYEKWLLKTHPEIWKHYVTNTKQNKINLTSQKARQENENWIKLCRERALDGKPIAISKSEVKTKLIEEKLKILNNYLKGDI